MEHKPWPKIPRYENVTYDLTEKLDGTNGIIRIQDGQVANIGSRERWLSETEDNHGFYKWVRERQDLLKDFNDAWYYGEFIGRGIQREYGLDHKRFYFFYHPKCRVNWDELNDAGFYLVPQLSRDVKIYDLSGMLEYHRLNFQYHGSKVNGFKRPEGIISNSSQNGGRIKIVFDKRK